MNLNLERIILFLKLNPAFIILIGLLNGIIPFFYFTIKRMELAPFVSCGFVLVFSIFSKLFPDFLSLKQIAKFAIFSMIGYCLALYSYRPSENNYSSLLPQRNCSSEVKALICDTTNVSANLEWMRKPSTLKAEAVELRISQNGKWKRCSGIFIIKLSDEMPIPGYGEVVVVKGAFIEPDGALFEGEFDYRQYLLSKGIRKVFNAVQISKMGSSQSYSVSLMKYILKCRDYILDSITKGMRIENRRMISALIFGCRHGLDFESRKNFLESGVIHIFAISGLHVGMLALTLYMVLRWAPFRFRYFAVPCLLIVYVITTGVQPSALRALLMISLWSFIKGLLYRTSSLNIVFLVASVMLFLNPLTVLDPGFQLSFIIAFFLVLSWNSVKEWSCFMGEKNLWLPIGVVTLKHHFITYIKNASFKSFSASLIAWLAGSSLLIFYRSFFIPGAVFTNFLIIPFVWLLFVGVLVGLFLIPLNSIFSLTGGLELLLDIIRSISFAGKEWGGGGNISAPSFIVLILFFILLFMLIISRKRIMFLCSLILLFSMISFCCFRRSFRKPKIAIFYGGESQEPAVISIPEEYYNCVAVINPGSKRRSKAILNYLKRDGINSIDYMIFTKNRKSCCQGAWLLVTGMFVKHAIFTPEYKRSRYARSAMKNCLEKGVYVTVLPKYITSSNYYEYDNSFVEFLKKNDSDYSIILNNDTSRLIIENELLSDGEKLIKVSRGRLYEDLNILNSMSLKLMVFE